MAVGSELVKLIVVFPDSLAFIRAEEKSVDPAGTDSLKVPPGVVISPVNKSWHWITVQKSIGI